MRFHLLIVSLVALASMTAALSAADADPEDYAFTEGDISYYLSVDGYLSVIDVADWSITELVIPGHVEHNGVTYTVTSIYMMSEGSPNLKRLYIPETVMHVQYIAGYDLEWIEVSPDSEYFVSIDGVLFDRMVSTLVRYPPSLGTSYTVPTTVTKLGYLSFGDSNLKQITLSDSIVSIGDSAFYGCRDLKLILNEKGERVLPRNLLSIGDAAFCFCTSLTELELNDDLRLIGWNAFSYSGIRSINIPYDVRHINHGAFSYCYDLAGITSSNDNYLVKDGVLFEKRNETYSLFCYPAGMQRETYTLFDGVDSICDLAFAGCKNLKEIRLPSSLIIVPAFAFSSCESLERIDLTNVHIINSCAFESCVNLKDVTLGNELYVIDTLAFARTGLETFTVPTSVVSVSDMVLAYCEDLRSVTFPETCEAEALSLLFYKCYNLESVTIESSDVTLTIDSLSVGEEGHEMTIEVKVPKGYSIPEDATDGYTELVVSVIGEKPYPYENILGVIACILILIGILRFVREV